MGLFEKDRNLNDAPHEVRLVVDASSFREKALGFQMRLDRFLAAHLKWRSRSSVQSLVKDGYVTVDRARPEAPAGTGRFEVERRPGARMQNGTRVVIRIPDQYRTLLLGETRDELDVLWEDSEALAVDKPPHIAIHPSGRHMTDTLIQRVHKRFEAEIESGAMLPRLCHRLDRETSGIVLVAKRPSTHAQLATQFEDRRVTKDYLAILDGQPPTPKGTIDAPIRLSTTSPVELEMTTAADGLPCRTDWETLAESDDCTLVLVHLHTGRQHQIRVHMAAIGAPLLGDKLYGPDREIFLRHTTGQLTDLDHERLVLDRHALHAHRLTFKPLESREPTKVTSPLPPDLTQHFPEFAHLPT